MLRKSTQNTLRTRGRHSFCVISQSRPTSYSWIDGNNALSRAYRRVFYAIKKLLAIGAVSWTIRFATSAKINETLVTARYSDCHTIVSFFSGPLLEANRFLLAPHSLHDVRVDVRVHVSDARVKEHRCQLIYANS